MRQCCLRMSTDPITDAREALREAVALAPSTGSEAAGPLLEALDDLAKALDRIEGSEGRLAAQLRRIKNGCPGKGRIADCRILAALSPSRGKTG